MNIRIAESRADLHRFVRLPFDLYRRDPAWVPPLIRRDLQRLDVRRNRFFQRADRELFLAMRRGRAVGRIAAIHERTREDGIGVFGFFECEDDPAACGALIDAAASWLKARGLRRIVGPINLTTFDEAGVLIDGHDRRPPFMANHHPPFYRRLLEACGFQKERDTLAFERDLIDGDGRAVALPPGLIAAAETVRARDLFRLRPLRLDEWDAEIRRVHEVLMRSFAELDGHVPIAEADFAAMARQMRPILDPRLLPVAEHRGQVVGFAFVLPEVNEVLAHLNGRLFPIGWARAWWHRRRIRTASFKLAGVLPEHRREGLAALLALEAGRSAQRLGFRRMEMSVILESNRRMLEFTQLNGATPYLRYRLYGRDL